MKKLNSKFAFLAIFGFVAACSPRLDSNYTFPEHEFTAIHEAIRHAHNGLAVIEHFGPAHSYSNHQMKDFGPSEIVEAIGRFFEEIIVEVMDPVVSEREYIIFNSDGSPWHPPEATDLSRIESIPGMDELLNACIHKVEDTSRGCLWDNWGILSNAWEDAGFIHP